MYTQHKPSTLIRKLFILLPILYSSPVLAVQPKSDELLQKFLNP